MALKATIFKADLQVSDMDRNYFGTHALTIARHPSETDERMMVRILAFALHAHELLAFGKGLSTDDEPDLWLEVGQPDEKRLLKACGRAGEVVVYSYSNAANVWWSQCAGKLERARNLRVYRLPTESSLALATLAQRSMQLQCTVQDGQIWFSGGDETVHIELSAFKNGQG